jgi:hypothetical protein
MKTILTLAEYCEKRAKIEQKIDSLPSKKSKTALKLRRRLRRISKQTLNGLTKEILDEMAVFLASIKIAESERDFNRKKANIRHLGSLGESLSKIHRVIRCGKLTEDDAQG